MNDDASSSLETGQAPFLHPGDTVEKYRIDSLIGYGGMGEVYLATHTLLNRQCALKILPPEIANRNPNHSKRFLREAKLATQFKHPNIIEVWDVGIDPVTKVNYIAMEYVRGQTIAEWLTGGPLEEKNVLIIATKVAEVLEVAQSLNIVHRDIKPSNIMITFEGDVKVADLGIAKSDPDKAAGESAVTLKDSILGTPFYASPEQCRTASQATTQSDIYSLGATMYHMLTGEKPYAGENSFEVMAKVLEEIPTPVHKVNPKVTLGTSRLVARMMAKEPQDRPAGPTELLKQLDALRTSVWARHPLFGQIFLCLGRIIHAIATTILRHRRKIAVVLLVLALLSGLGYGGRALYRLGRQYWHQRQESKTTVTEPVPTELAETPPDSQEDEPADEAAPEYPLPIADRPLAWRLDAAQKRLAALESELAQANLLPASRITLRRKIIFRRTQILTLKEQYARRGDVLGANLDRPVATTAALGQAVDALIAAAEKDATGRADLSQKLLDALQASTGNPNAVLIRLLNSNAGDHALLLETLLPPAEANPERTTLLEELKKRSADFNLIPAEAIAESLQHSERLLAAIVNQGLENIDGVESGQYLLAAMQLPGPEADALCRDLIMLNSAVNVIDRKTGQTPLHLAASQGRLELAAMIVYADAIVSAFNRDGRTAFQVAQASGNPHLLALLQLPDSQ